MRVFLQALTSILFDEELDIDIPTKAFKSYRFNIPIYAGARLTPALSHLALRAKEDNDLIARKFLAKLICDAISLTSEEEISVIVIPSRKAADKFRGIKHINELVKEVTRLKPIRNFDLLRHTRKVQDQSTLSHRERLENLDSAFEISKDAKRLPTKAFLMDDLVTSGATILAASKALQVRNIQLLGVITACATMVFTE